MDLISICSVIYFALTSLKKQNIYELIAFFAMTIMLVMGVLCQTIENYKKGKDHVIISLMTLIINLFAFASYILLYNNVYEMFSWNIYARIGASKDHRTGYKNYALFKAFAKLYIVVTFINSITNLVYLDSSSVIFMVLDILMIPLSILFSIWGVKAMQNENVPFLYIFLGFSIFTSVSIISKICYLFISAGGIEAGFDSVHMSFAG